MNIKLLVSLVTTAALVSCGGSEQSKSTPTNATPTQQTSDSAAQGSSVVVEPHTQTGNLTVSPTFEFSSSFALEVNVDLESANGQSAFFNLCVSKGDNLTPDYQQCLVRSKMSNGTLLQSLTVASHHDSLIGEVVFFDEAKNSLFYYWKRDASRKAQVFVIK